MGFREWLFLVERSLVDPAVLDSYEHAFQQGLEGLIQRARNPELRRTFEDMRQFRFVNYIMGALIRHGIQQKYDVEDCLQRIVFRMLSPVGERGLSKDTLFDVDLNRSYVLEVGNPLQARFCTYLTHELRTIMGGRIPALKRTQRSASLSIGYAHDPGEVSPDEIPARAASGEQEMLGDIMELLKRRSAPGMPLADLFVSILKGEGTRTQRARFGHAKADAMRKIIVGVIEQYARQTQNLHLLRLLDKFRDFSGNQPNLVRPKPSRPQKPAYPPDEADFRSIVSVLEKHGRSVSMVVLGSARRRWLERPPRDPNSPYPNRLADVLAKMMSDGVLRKKGARYVPGPAYSRYVEQEPVGVREGQFALIPFLLAAEGVPMGRNGSTSTPLSAGCESLPRVAGPRTYSRPPSGR